MGLRHILYFCLFITATLAIRSQIDVKLDADYGEFPNGAFLLRFPISEGASFHSSVRLKLTAPFNKDTTYPMFIYYLTDQEWQLALSENTCTAYQKYAKFTLEQTLRGDGDWSRWEAFEIEAISESQIWYAVIADCRGYTHRQYPTMPFIEVDIHMLNSGSEFSSEEYSTIWLNLILFVIYVYFLFSTTIHVVREAVAKDKVEGATMGVILAIYMELLHIILIMGYYYTISNHYGQGFYFLYMLSTVCQMHSQLTISGILVMIAFGWSITDVDILAENKSDKDSVYLKIVVYRDYLLGAGLVILFVNTFASFLTIFDHGAHYQSHKYSGWAGFVLVFIRLAVYVMFLYGVTNTIKAVPEKTKMFLKALGASGTLYMLAFPTLWLLSFLIPEIYRNRWIVFGNMTVQLFAIIILLNQLSKKSSLFNEHAKKKSNVL